MYIYILHAESPLFTGSNTQHYSGQTINLRTRFEVHAKALGARLTREFVTNGIKYRVGAWAQCNKTVARRVERKLKDTHEISMYCGLCQGSKARPIPETIPLDLSLLPFDDRSEVYHADILTSDLSIRPAQPDDIAWIAGEMHKEKVELGFLKKTSLTEYQQTGRIAIAESIGEGTRHGYAVYSISHDQLTIKIQQCYVQDASRRQLIGQALINYIEARHPRSALTCHVREDLPANAFWTSIGFEHIHTKGHKTSGQKLIRYSRPSFTSRIILARKDS